MIFVHDPEKQMTVEEKEIMQALQHKSFENYLANPQIKALRHYDMSNNDLNEDIWLFCLHKSMGDPEKYPLNGKQEIIPIDISETSKDCSSASASINRNFVNKKCPPNDYWRVWYHTHNSVSSAQSVDDQFAGESLHKANIGNVMCSAGILGVTCHLHNGGAPKVIDSKWSENFWIDLNNKDKRIWKNPKTNENVSKIQMDQVLCYYDNPNRNQSTRFTCSGKNFDFGTEDFQLGNFGSIALNAEIDYVIDYLGTGLLAKPLDGKFECTVLGDKLVCH